MLALALTDTTPAPHANHGGTCPVPRAACHVPRTWHVANGTWRTPSTYTPELCVTPYAVVTPYAAARMHVCVSLQGSSVYSCGTFKSAQDGQAAISVLGDTSILLSAFDNVCAGTISVVAKPEFNDQSPVDTTCGPNASTTCPLPLPRRAAFW